MIKNVIKTCSCFVDKAIWFVNLSKQVVYPWRFDHVRRQTPIEDIIENKFIKEFRTTRTYIDGKSVVKNTIVISCVDCFEFQLLLLSSEEKSIFDTINYRFVSSDSFSYGDDFSSDIFTGNSQFVVKKYFLSREQRELLFLNCGSNNDNFSRQPLHKSCFTSLQKTRYRFFLCYLQKSL